MNQASYFVARISEAGVGSTLQATVVFLADTTVGIAVGQTVDCSPPAIAGTNPPAKDDVWLVQVVGTNYVLSANFTRKNLIFIDSHGTIGMIHKGNPPSDLRPLDSPWKAYRSPPTAGSGQAGVDYFMYFQTPPGYYTCALLPPTGEIPFGVFLLSQVEVASVIPSSPSTIQLGGIDLVALKFSYSSVEDDSRAVQMYRPLAPEYPTRDHCVVAYPLSVVRPKETIRVCLSTINYKFANRILYLRAYVRGSVNAGLIGCTPFTFWANSNDAVLYSSYGNMDGYVPFDISIHQLAPMNPLVGSYSSTWEWQYCLEDPSSLAANWHDIEKMEVDLHMTLNYPGYPWSNAPYRQKCATVNSAPLVGLVRIACRFATGAVDNLTATLMIAKKIIASGIFIYDLAPRYTAYKSFDDDSIPVSTQGMTVAIIDMLETLSGMMGRPLTVNCVDLSRTLILLANCIGCEVKGGMLSNVNPAAGFDLNPHIPRGTYATIENGHFNYHQVAYIGDKFDENALIFDTCLDFMDPGKDPQPILGMPFKDYIARLVTPAFKDQILMTDLVLEEMTLD